MKRPTSTDMMKVVERWQSIARYRKNALAVEQIAQWAFSAGQKAAEEKAESYRNYQPTGSDAIILHAFGVKWD